MAQKPSYLDFDNSKYYWQTEIDYKKHPEKYKVGKGEQGVLICQPYKQEIGQYWRFKNREVAQESSNKIFALFLGYLKNDDFVGADMARKYLQMGFTRARRYYNYKGGKKYDKEHNYQLNERFTGEPEKKIASDIFYKKWMEAEHHKIYKERKAAWLKEYG